jgi:spore germination cell wall hydrolase CwlJ-like protein
VLDARGPAAQGKESKLIQLLGNRGASAVMGFFMLALASSEAPAQVVTQAGPAFDVSAAVKSIETDNEAAPLGTRTYEAQPIAKATVAAVTPTATPAAQTRVPTVTALYATKAAQTVTVALPSTSAAAPAANVAAASAAAPAIAREATWLFKNGWPLYALVDRYGAGASLDEQANCMAVAIYHEARGESLEGQLAVARVIMNRAASGKDPPSWCGTVKQPWQFSFVNPRTGQMPGVNVNSASWRKAQAITRLAIANVVPSLSNDVLWYHADYVAPSWGRRLSFVSKIGTHIFYRS